jgi:tubulin--tyrosine ligase
MHRYQATSSLGLSLGSVRKPSFYFFNDRTAIRFHIARRLLSLGWESVPRESEASFSDRHLSLNDEITLNLEYKHLLADLTQRYCPAIMPITYCVNDDNYSEVFSKMIYQHYMPQGNYAPNIKGLKWILKPSTLNNGDFIKLFNNVEELKKYYSQSNRLGGNHVVQQYLPNPALIDGRKYTFRMPVVFTNYVGIFLYRQGYINISAHPFDLEDGFVDRKVHITNYVLDGEFSHIEQRSTQKLANFAEIYSQMVTIVTAVTKALLKIAPGYLKPQATKIFEVFGFDFILDQQGKVWLLEINQGPDAPTFEDNVLSGILWDNFWTDIMEDFVLPIALQQSPKNNYQNFSQLLPATKCYSAWDNFLRRFF